MWYRCEKHGSYNVDDNTPHIQVHCPTCARREEGKYLLPTGEEFIDEETVEKIRANPPYAI